MERNWFLILEGLPTFKKTCVYTLILVESQDKLGNKIPNWVKLIFSTSLPFINPILKTWYLNYCCCQYVLNLKTDPGSAGIKPATITLIRHFGNVSLCVCPTRALRKPSGSCPWTRTTTWSVTTVRWVLRTVHTHAHTHTASQNSLRRTRLDSNQFSVAPCDSAFHAVVKTDT